MLKCVCLVFLARVPCNCTFPLLPPREGKHVKKYSVAFTPPLPPTPTPTPHTHIHTCIRNLRLTARNHSLSFHAHYGFFFPLFLANATRTTGMAPAAVFCCRSPSASRSDIHSVTVFCIPRLKRVGRLSFCRLSVISN